MNKNLEKLIFVYNADSSIFAQVSDVFKKVVTPSKYECNLCMITYGAVSMKDEWKKFLATIPFEKEFLHKNEFRVRFPELSNIELPVIFTSEGNTTKILLSAKDINEQKNIDELIKLMKNRLQNAYHLQT